MSRKMTNCSEFIVEAVDKISTEAFLLVSNPIFILIYLINPFLIRKIILI